MLQGWGMSVIEENSIAIYQIGQTPFISEWEICLKNKPTEKPKVLPCKCSDEEL